MRITYEQRLQERKEKKIAKVIKQIRLRKPIFSKVCWACDDLVSGEKMWFFDPKDGSSSSIHCF